MFGDRDWPLNASRGLSAITEFLVKSVLMLFAKSYQNRSVHVENIENTAGRIWRVFLETQCITEFHVSGRGRGGGTKRRRSAQPRFL